LVALRPGGIPPQGAIMGVDYLNGWDAMVATSQTNVNNAMVLAYNANLLPHAAKASFSFKVFGIDIQASIDCTLGPWWLSGGSGKNVEISIPFTGGTLTIAGTSYPLAGVILQVTCLLSYIKSPIKPVSGTDYTLQVDFVSPDAIVAVQVENPPPGFDPSGIDIVLLNFLKSEFGGHTYDIATVNLQAVQEDYPYLIPTLFEYAIDTNTTDPNSSVFGVQMLTVNKTPGNQDIIPGTIPTGSPICDSAALVSNQLFAQKLLLPGVATALSVDASKLTTHYTGGSWTIVNTEDITLPTSHNPTVTSLTAYVDNNLVHFNVVGNCEATPGIDISFTMTAQYAMQVVTTGTTQTINLVQQGSPDVQHSVSVATWVIITTAALAALVLIVMGPLAALLVAGIEALIVYLVATIANNKAGDVLSTSMPSIVPAKVNWAHMNIFTVKQVLLPTPLQIGGTMPILSAS
jgi:Clostridium P-47 protein